MSLCLLLRTLGHLLLSHPKDHEKLQSPHSHRTLEISIKQPPGLGCQKTNPSFYTDEKDMRDCNFLMLSEIFNKVVEFGH